jgi:hypothetical protein
LQPNSEEARAWGRREHKMSEAEEFTKTKWIREYMIQNLKNGAQRKPCLDLKCHSSDNKIKGTIIYYLWFILPLIFHSLPFISPWIF